MTLHLHQTPPYHAWRRTGSQTPLFLKVIIGNNGQRSFTEYMHYYNNCEVNVLDSGIRKGSGQVPTIDMDIVMGNRQYLGQPNSFPCAITKRHKHTGIAKITSFLCVKWWTIQSASKKLSTLAIEFSPNPFNFVWCPNSIWLSADSALLWRLIAEPYIHNNGTRTRDQNVLTNCRILLSTEQQLLFLGQFQWWALMMASLI